MDSIDELQAAVEEPESFLRSVAGAAGPAAKKMAIGKLRSKLEPIVTQQGLAWEDAVPALDLVDSVEELQAAIGDPEGFMQSVMGAAGPAAKKLLIAKLRPVLLPLLPKRGLKWGDVEMAMEMVSSVDDLEKAAADPAAFLKQFS